MNKPYPHMIALALVAIALLFLVFPCHAQQLQDTLTVNKPLRGDVYTGALMSFDPANHSVDFQPTHDEPYAVIDDIFHSDLDEAWDVWEIFLCSDLQSCITLHYICASLSDDPYNRYLDCLNVDC